MDLKKKLMNTDTMKKPIKNIHALNKRISDLKIKQLMLENKMDHNFQHLRENFLGMGLNSIFGKWTRASSFWTEIVTHVMESEKLQQAVKNFVNKITDKIGDALK
ncbi:MAG: hypothetical protein RLZ76_1779 [Bacteroidota bacterium]